MAVTTFMQVTCQSILSNLGKRKVQGGFQCGINITILYFVGYKDKAGHTCITNFYAIFTCMTVRMDMSIIYKGHCKIQTSTF